MKFKFFNSKGEVFYGVHFYPGVAEYRPKNEKPFRVFLNESTIRKMDKTFQGRPVFVSHVEGVEQDIDVLRTQADGYVIRSFYNESDGKHWAQFIVTTERGLEAIKKGWKLSNCYLPKGPFGSGGYWNGVEYEREVLDGEFEHLALVPDPRYEDAPPIMSPDEFKAYNDRTSEELRRVANNKGEGSFMFFKRQKVENSKELEGMSVQLPKSKREVELSVLVNEADEKELAKDKPQFANADHLVKIGDSEMSVKDLSERYNAACGELMDLKKKNADAMEPVDEEGEEEMENQSEEDDKKEEKKKEEEKAKNAKEEADAAEVERKAEEKAKAKAKADALRNAREAADKKPPEQNVMLMSDRIKKGQELFGS